MKRYPTLKAIEKAAEEYAGWCIACGRKHHQVDPDTHGEKCENSKCGKLKVYGAEEMGLMGMVR